MNKLFTVKSVFQKERNLQGANCYLSQFHTITLISMPQFKEKQHSEFPNESTLLQPCNKSQIANQKTSVTDKMKINKHRHYLQEKKIKMIFH